MDFGRVGGGTSSALFKTRQQKPLTFLQRITMGSVCRCLAGTTRAFLSVGRRAVWSVSDTPSTSSFFPHALAVADMV
jgi:hypothetical protein